VRCAVPTDDELDIDGTQQYSCVVIPPFETTGELPAGIHLADWQEFESRFGGTSYRQELLAGLLMALRDLKDAGCETVYIDGSFVTAKEVPGDFDACWDPVGVDPTKLDPTLLTFDSGRMQQKLKYRGELFPSSSPADGKGSTFLEFFQTDRDGLRKGIIAIDLRGLP
jgi:hypothetical protein